METLVFASNNAHKLEEIRNILGGKFEIKCLKDIGCDVDIPETGETFHENAMQKALYVKKHFGYDCFADDSGLEVDALNGAPGIYSARYSAMSGFDGKPGQTKDERNIDCLLAKLIDIAPTDSEVLSQAQFRTSIALIYHGETHYFDGIVRGTIINECRGSEGFGYDPLFVPDGYTETFAQLGAEIKNGISHRARAVAQLTEFLTGKQAIRKA